MSMERMVLLQLLTLCAVATASQSYQVLFVRSDCQEVSDSVAQTAEQRANDLLEGSAVNISVTESSSSVLDSLIEVLRSPPTQMALLFAGCSDDTETVAEIANSRLVNITLFTYAFTSVPSSNPELSRHFRMVPSERYLAIGTAAFIKEFDWNRAVIISENLPVFTAIADVLNESLAMDISVTETLLPPDPINVEFPRDNRIFVLNMFPDAARAVLCEAAMQNLSYPGYVWVTYGWYQDRWWEGLQSSSDNCTDDDIEAFLEGAVAISHLPSGNTSSSIGVNSLYADYASDAVSAIALAINKTGDVSNMQEFTTALEASDFIGESGSVSFHNGIRTPSRITIQQYRKDGSVTLQRQDVASYIPPPTEESNLSFFPGESVLTLWPSLEGAVPLDGTPLTQENFPLVPLVVVCYLLATAGIVFAVFCLLFNIIFRNKTLIRLTSPNLNYVTIIGAIVFYSAVYTFFYVEGTSPLLKEISCTFRLWLASLGYTICYVPINAKMWRVYHICHRPKPSMKNSFLKDWHLMLMVLFFVAVDVIILTTVTAIDGTRYFAKTIPDRENPGTIVNEAGYTVEFVVDRCFSSTEPIWLSVVFGYKIILQAIGCFLAFNIRKVKIKGLNDSKEVSAILYITSVIIAVFIVVTFVYGDYVNVDGGTYALGICAATTVVLTFIYIPKMYGLYRDPKGKKIFEGPPAESRAGGKNNAVTSGTEVSGDNVLEEGESVSSLKKRVRELETKLNSSNDASGNISIEMDNKDPPSSQSE